MSDSPLPAAAGPESAAAERLAPGDPRLSFDGIAGWERGGGDHHAELPLRMPVDRLATAMSANFSRLARTTAGVRFAVRTDASELELENDPGGSPLDVRVDGVLAHRWTGGPGRHRIAFPLPGAGGGPAEVEVWLPHLSVTRIAAVTLRGHRQLLAAERTGRRLLVHGSSLTHCMYAAGPSESWPALVAAGRGWRLRNLGFAGEAYLDPLVARIIRDTPADLITLELGINAHIRGAFTARSWGAAVCGFLETIRDGHPHTPVVVLTPLSSPERERAVNSAGLTLEDTRSLAAEAVRVLQRLGDRALHLLDGSAIAPVADAGRLYADGLHPTAAGEYVLADRIGAELANIPPAPEPAPGTGENAPAAESGRTG
ncbi:SGNH/GDSL hydrolase family protein [Streptomyces sp. ATCC51928]|uniref:GDSL-type esterase/lipase family protein n=1 Tax=Streptomyces caviscabies TaxID=90079 RepID=A0ABW2MCL6_9ACTN|nr:MULTISPECIES: GDSL-type esterase/lipase family protein [unclassified Streptomyces]MDX3502167.1 SGNH/GDSL hydrolase family protein [Streptomyces sp. ATCC51928]MDX5522713.1 SGNH/GDSL hydrolase family protein [Streptomyces sp. DE06-01C]